MDLRERRSERGGLRDRDGIISGLEEAIIKRVAALGGGIAAGLIQVALAIALVLATATLAVAPARPRCLVGRRPGRSVDAEAGDGTAPLAPGRPAGDPAAPGRAGRSGVRAVGLLGPTILAETRPPAVGEERPTAAELRRRGVRRVGVMLLLLLAAVAGGAGVYTWQVTAALDEAQRAIYQPLPADAGQPSAPAAGGDSAAAAAPAPPTPTTAPSGNTFGAILGAAATDEDPALDPIWRGKRYINVLVLGFDSRDDDANPPRSDVFLIAQLDLNLKTVNIVSVPRDLWLTVPGYGEERINAAYALGWRADQPLAGVALAKRTVEQNFGLPIDYYVAVDFRGFQQVVDAVGGVEVDVPYYLRDDEYPTEDYGTERIEFFPGKQRLDGKTALKYVRTRHQDSDYGRRRRQQQVLVALFDRAKSVNIVPRLPSVLRSFGGTVQTNFTFEEQLALGRVALALDRNNIKTYSIDEAMTEGWITPGGASVVRGDWRQIDLLLDTVFAGRTRTVRGP